MSTVAEFKGHIDFAESVAVTELYERMERLIVGKEVVKLGQRHAINSVTSIVSEFKGDIAFV